MALYIFGVGIFSAYFQNARASYIIAFIATGLIAILFQPLRERLQRGVNRLMYGERDDPATLLSRLSQQIDTTLTPESVLPTIVETLAQALRLPYAGIRLHSSEGESRIIAAFGKPPPDVIQFPLTYQGESIGEMLLAPRAPGEAFSSADLKLLNIIAQQAGLAAYTVNLTATLMQLNTDLQQSRERLVVAIEEERRRLRRDLHDGVGPTLASLSHRIDAAADLVMSDPQASVGLLRELKGQIKSTLTEIRRLVYALRPPVLDEFGLVSAIREHTAPYAGPGGLAVSFEAAESLPDLPAAVEVAAYRIALEAFTNIVNHAQASRCQILIQVEDSSLRVEITDDGTGIQEDAHRGVGLSSMHERANELGGECLIENLPTGGTRVRARLPLALPISKELNYANPDLDR
jgi:signal transduction histidine kinase